ncbi:hypothetical protein SLA2020_522810 [Shorea laevis]
MQMGKLGNHQKSKNSRKIKKNPIRITYISSPMMVKATAAEFRAIVQELTGRDSGFECPRNDHAETNIDSSFQNPGNDHVPADMQAEKVSLREIDRENAYGPFSSNMLMELDEGILRRSLPENFHLLTFLFD